MVWFCLFLLFFFGVIVYLDTTAEMKSAARWKGRTQKNARPFHKRRVCAHRLGNRGKESDNATENILVFFLFVFVFVLVFFWGVLWFALVPKLKGISLPLHRVQQGTGMRFAKKKEKKTSLQAAGENKTVGISLRINGIGTGKERTPEFIGQLSSKRVAHNTVTTHTHTHTLIL